MLKFLLISIFLPVAVMANQSPIQIIALAKVDKTVITNRDLKVHQFFNEKMPPLKSFSDGASPLEEFIWETLIYSEYQETLLDSVKKSAMDKHCREVIVSLKKDKDWNRLQVSQKEANYFCQLNDIVRDVVSVKLSSSLVLIRDNEIKAYYRDNKVQLGQKSFKEVEQTIRKGLQQQKNSRRFKDWISTIRKKHGVSYFSGYQLSY